MPRQGTPGGGTASRLLIHDRRAMSGQARLSRADRGPESAGRPGGCRCL